jgi:hypothetical protein
MFLSGMSTRERIVTATGLLIVLALALIAPLTPKSSYWTQVAAILAPAIAGILAFTVLGERLSAVWGGRGVHCKNCLYRLSLTGDAELFRMHGMLGALQEDCHAYAKCPNCDARIEIESGVALRQMFEELNVRTSLATSRAKSLPADMAPERRQQLVADAEKFAADVGRLVHRGDPGRRAYEHERDLIAQLERYESRPWPSGDTGELYRLLSTIVALRKLQREKSAT